MKSRTFKLAVGVVLFAELATPLLLIAQDTRYKLIDIGTLGGPSAHGPGNGAGSQLLNNAGQLAGTADTSEPDPNLPNCANCFVSHAFRWNRGILTDLEPLSGVNWTHGNAINARGWVAGTSTNGEIDPLNPCGLQPLCLQFHAVLWDGIEIVDLGTLGGLTSDASYVNDGGQVVGSSTINTTPDPFSFLGAQTHAFIWKNGVMRDLGTLGGTDSGASSGCDNQHSNLVVGGSFTDPIPIPNPSTGFPTQHAFLWENGRMTDIPTLGGTSAGAQCANNQGQVIGQSNLTGDNEQHAFFWDHGTLSDLGTLGGTFSMAIWLNNAGEAVGFATTPGDALLHATHWKNGTITDLGTLDGDCFSLAWAINSKGQIVGQSFSCDGSTARTVLWDKGSIIDLQLTSDAPLNINDRGEIAGVYRPVGCDNTDLCSHAFILVPCNEAGVQGCDNVNIVAQPNPAIATRAATATPDPRKTRELVSKWRARLAQRHAVLGIGRSRN
jgi:probable HAF family extracellular repeat protein